MVKNGKLGGDYTAGTALEALATFYDETGRGFELRRVGGGWRYWTRVEHADVIRSGHVEQPALASRLHPRTGCRGSGGNRDLQERGSRDR